MIALNELGNRAAVGRILSLNPHIRSRKDLIYVGETILLPTISNSTIGDVSQAAPVNTSELPNEKNISPSSDERSATAKSIPVSVGAEEPSAADSSEALDVSSFPLNLVAELKDMYFGAVCYSPDHQLRLNVGGSLEFGNESAPLTVTISPNAVSTTLEGKDVTLGIVTSHPILLQKVEGEGVLNGGGNEWSIGESVSIGYSLYVHSDDSLELEIQVKIGQTTSTLTLSRKSLELQSGIQIPLSKWIRLNLTYSIELEENPQCVEVYRLYQKVVLGTFAVVGTGVLVVAALSASAPVVIPVGAVSVVLFLMNAQSDQIAY